MNVVQDVLDLIEGKGFGILSVIDDEVSIPRATDLTLLRKLRQAYVSPSSVETIVGKETLTEYAKRFFPASSAANDSFIIGHYAGRYCISRYYQHLVLSICC